MFSPRIRPSHLTTATKAYNHLPTLLFLLPSLSSSAPARPFTSTPHPPSGHNRWSKIKHDKAKTDAVRTRQRSTLAAELVLASRSGGPHPSTNPKLAALLAQASKIGFTKASCEQAIARGQGKSTSGQALEGYTMEVLHQATGAALLVECLTDNKARTGKDLREVMKGCGAGEGRVEWMFERRGRVVVRSAAAAGSATGEEGTGLDGRAEGVGEGLEGRTDDLDEEAVMEAALAAGAADVEFGQGNAEVLTEPSEMAAVAEKMEAALGRQVESAELVWVPNADMVVELREGSEQAEQLEKLVERLEDVGEVSDVWVNTR